MTQSTILLGELPRMMRTIVEGALTSQSDLRVAEDSEGSDLETAVTRSGADVLIVEERADRGEAFYRGLIAAHPSLKVLMLTQGGRNVTLLAFRRVRLAEASPTSLIAAIRSELRREAGTDE